jgi:hypothetical protein
LFWSFITKKNRGLPLSWNSSRLSTLAHKCHLRFFIICAYLNHLFSSFQIFCEVAKQVSNYSLQYFNHSHFPIPQTCIVVLCELVKLVTTFMRAKCKFLIASLDFTGHENGILLPELFWPTGRKNCSCDRENLLKFKAGGREFAKILRSLEQFIQIGKGQNNFWYQNPFSTCSWSFPYLIN